MRDSPKSTDFTNRAVFQIAFLSRSKNLTRALSGNLPKGWLAARAFALYDKPSCKLFKADFKNLAK